MGKTLATKRKSNATLSAIEGAKDEICKASPAKKPKLSLHSRRCEHSPHNQRNKRRIEKACTVVSGSRPTDKEPMKSSPPKDGNDALRPQSPNQEKIAVRLMFATIFRISLLRDGLAADFIKFHDAHFFLHIDVR